MRGTQQGPPALYGPCPKGVPGPPEDAHCAVRTMSCVKKEEWAHPHPGAAVGILWLPYPKKQRAFPRAMAS